MADKPLSLDEISKFIQPLLTRVDFTAPDLAARSCGCGCGCQGGGGGGGGGGNGRAALAVLEARSIIPPSK